MTLTAVASFLVQFLTVMCAVWCVFVQQCDQVHIDDVAADDNGIDLQSVPLFDFTAILC